MTVGHFECDQCGASFDDGITAGHHEMSHRPHWHVATGLAGYGPEASDSDGFATFASLADALEYARDELVWFVDYAHEGAHAFGEAGQFEDAWKEVLRVEELENLRANLSPTRRLAPLYRDDPAAYAALQESQAAEFPHDVSHNTRLYLWQCETPDDCDSAKDWLGEREEKDRV